MTIHDQFSRPLRDLRISVIDNCNFRCTYCMPAEIFGHNYRFLEGDQLLGFDEIERIVRAFARLGVRKVKLTGGEPLLRPWLHKLVEQLAAIPGIEDIGLITNGYYLKSQAPYLRRAGLRRVSVSLDSLDQETFTHIAGRSHPLSRILEAIEAAFEVGMSPVKINTVIQRGVNDHEVVDFVRHFADTPHIVRFIEYMDVGTRNDWSRSKTVPSAELLERIRRVYTVEPVDENYYGEVADRYRVRETGGEIGFISSVSQPFCGDCTRARVSADGELFTCLFASRGRSLRDELRGGLSDEGLVELLASIWRVRADRYSEDRAENRQHTEEKVEMYRVGG